MAKDLKNTILVDGDTYNINAVEADKVKNSFEVKSVGLGGTVLQNTVTFDGSDSKEIIIVPASGGKFTGPIRVKSAAGDDGDAYKNVDRNGNFVDEAVLNYKDIKDNVLNQLLNTTVMYTWSGQTLNPNISTSINGLSLVLGSENELDDFHNDNKTKLANNNTYLSSYIYIDKDTGNLYLGLVGEESPIQLAKLATLSSEANKLTKILPTTEGGTGLAINSLNELTVGKASQLETGRAIKVNLAKNSNLDAQTFNGTSGYESGVQGVLKEANGGTGQASLAKVTVGKATEADKSTNALNDQYSRQIDTYYQKKILIKSASDRPNGPLSTDGTTGDIMIIYSNN
jgi:hypothetical protein